MSRMSPDADGQQTERCVQYRYQGNRWAERRYFHRERTARRYANRIVEHPTSTRSSIYRAVPLDGGEPLSVSTRVRSNRSTGTKPGRSGKERSGKREESE